MPDSHPPTGACSDHGLTLKPAKRPFRTERPPMHAAQAARAPPEGARVQSAPEEAGVIRFGREGHRPDQIGDRPLVPVLKPKPARGDAAGGGGAVGDGPLSLDNSILIDGQFPYDGVCSTHWTHLQTIEEKS